MKPNEIPEVAKLLKSYWESRGMSYSQKWAERYVREGHGTDIKRDQFFTFREKGRLIGCASLAIYEGDVAEIRDLVVVKEKRGIGYGSMIMKELVSWAKKNGVRKLYTLCLPASVKLCKNLGFAKEGVLKSHFAPGENLTVMSLILKKA